MDVKSIGEICTITSGLWKGKKPPFANVRILRNTNFADDGILDFTDAAQHEVEVRQLEQRTLRRGDILLEKSGGGPKQPVGRVAIFESAECEYSFSNFTSRIRVIDESVLLPRYLWRYLHKLYLTGITASMQSQTSGIRNLDLSVYKKIEIPLPPIDEQKRIVGILDEADRLRQLRKKANERMAAFLPALFLNMFGDPQTNPKEWEMVLMSVVCNVKGGFAFKSIKFTENGIPIIRIGNIQDGTLRIDNLVYYPRIDDYLTNYQLHEKDVLIAMSGATTGKIAMVRKFDLPALQNQRVGNFYINDLTRLDPYFLFFLLRTEYFQQKIWGHAIGGAQPNISGKQLESIEIFLPPIGLQKKFSAIAADAEVEMQKQSHATVGVEDLFQSLLAQAFSQQ